MRVGRIKQITSIIQKWKPSEAGDNAILYNTLVWSQEEHQHPLLDNNDKSPLGSEFESDHGSESDGVTEQNKY